MKRHKTLILNKKDIEKLVNMREAVTAVEDCFREYGLGRTQMPPKIYLHVNKYRGDFRAMPAYIERLNRCSVKWVNVHPRNRRFGLPSVMAIIILSDPKNGLPLCIMDGTAATGIRTGAGAAVAAKYLARKDSKVVGMVGCGVQARTQLQALQEIFDIREVRVKGQRKSSVARFIKDMRNQKFRLYGVNSIEECVRDADIVVTTTSSMTPLVRQGWIKEGAHINAIGADAKGKQELDPKILLSSKVVVDSWPQASHSGEINVPLTKGIITKKDIYADIGEIVTGKKKGRTNKSEITVFDSTGLAIQDTAVASLIYETATRKKAGIWIRFL